MNRVIRCVKPIPSEYITVGEDYTYSCGYADQVGYKRVTGNAGSFMGYAKFKRCLANGSIVFVDNLPKEQQ